MVATDDERRERGCFGGTAVMTSADHATGNGPPEVARALSCEIVVNVQGDEPLIEPSSIDAVEAVARPARRRHVHRSARIDDATDLTNPSVVKVVTDARGYALYFTRSAVPTSALTSPRRFSGGISSACRRSRSFLLKMRRYLRASSNAPKAWNSCAP